MQSKDVIRGIVEDQNKLLVCFENHDGYFHVDDPPLRDLIHKVQHERREVSFIFDGTLNILSLD